MDENKKETKKVTLNDLKDVSGGLPTDGGLPKLRAQCCQCYDCGFDGKMNNSQGKCPSCGSVNIKIY